MEFPNTTYRLLIRHLAFANTQQHGVVRFARGRLWTRKPAMY